MFNIDPVATGIEIHLMQHIQYNTKNDTTTITAADINKLRQQTGAGIMDCRKALLNQMEILKQL